MKFRVVTPVEHDQKRYEPDSAIDLTEEQAQPLLALGAIATPSKAKAAAQQSASNDQQQAGGGS